MSEHENADNVMATMGNYENKAGNCENKMTTGNEIRYADDKRKDKLYEPKHKQKLVRVLTVVAYVIFVSMAAILLSLYYTFLWDPKDLSVKMRMKPECAHLKMPKALTTPPIINETQMERMTAKLTTARNELSELDVETTTIKRPRDILTILTESTSATKMPLGTSSSTVSEEPQTDFSPTTQSHSENTT